MSNESPSNVFLAGSTVELISAITCIDGLGIRNVAVFVERNLSFGATAMDPLLTTARQRFPAVHFIELRIDRAADTKGTGKKGLRSFRRRWEEVRSIRRQLEEYPHGFDHPRRQQVREYCHLVCRRSLRTVRKPLRRGAPLRWEDLW